MVAVAVLLTHIDKNAVATINPPTRATGFVPMTRRMVRAMRRCRFHRSMVNARTKPPRKRKTRGLA